MQWSENTRNVLPGMAGQHGSHAALSLQYLPYMRCSYMHGHVHNVGPHLAAITDGHETSQRSTKHSTLSPSISFIKFHELLLWEKLPFLTTRNGQKQAWKNGPKIHKILTLACEEAPEFGMARKVTKFHTYWWCQLNCGMTLREFTNLQVDKKMV